MSQVIGFTEDGRPICADSVSEDDVSAFKIVRGVDESQFADTDIIEAFKGRTAPQGTMSLIQAARNMARLTAAVERLTEALERHQS